MKKNVFLLFCAAMIFFSATPYALSGVTPKTKDESPPAAVDQQSSTPRTEETLTDLGAYKKIFFYARTHQQQSGDYELTPWKDEALGYVAAWDEFIEKYPDSKLVAQAYIRMAEWYLTIRPGDAQPRWGKKDENPNAVKDNPELLDTTYRNEALKLLNYVIKNFPYDDHLSDVGNMELVYNDKVGAVALYTRAMFFPGYCKNDLARLEKEFPGLPSTKEALLFLSKKCGYKIK